MLCQYQVDIIVSRKKRTATTIKGNIVFGGKAVEGGVNLGKMGRFPIEQHMHGKNLAGSDGYGIGQGKDIKIHTCGFLFPERARIFLVSLLTLACLLPSGPVAVGDETVHQSEIVVEERAIEERLSAKLGYYYSQITDMIKVGDDLSYTNTDSEVEMEMEMEMEMESFKFQLSTVPVKDFSFSASAFLMMCLIDTFQANK